MNNNIILSIIVPTYTRVKFLETTVQCFIDQIKAGKLENEVELIIGNDASKDTTSAYVDQIDAQYDFVYGFNNLKNLGVSQNIEFLLEKARGTYVLMCGDDDLLKDGTIAYIIKCIKDKKPNFIILNTSNMLSLDDANHNFKITLENRLNIFEDIFVENFQKDRDLLKPARNWLYLTNILPAVVFKRDLYISELAVNAKKYLRPENVFLWQAPVIIGISKYGKLLVISKCFVLHRKNETNWSNDIKSLLSVNLFDSIEICRLVKDYMPSEYKKYKKLYAAFVMKTFIVETEKGKNIRKFAWNALFKNLDCFPENIQFLGMAVAPKFITGAAPKLHEYKKRLLK